MNRTILGIVFIAATAAGAIVLALKPTVARGDALAGIVFEPKAGVAYTCEDEVVVEGEGPTFQCTAKADDGATETYEVHIDRDGHFDAKIVSP